MTAVLLRRRGLGAGSCGGIVERSTTGIQVVRNDNPQWPDDLFLVIRWGCTSNVPIKNVLNSAAAIHTVANKSEFRKLTESVSPISIFEADDYNENLKYVVRPSTHSQGRHLYFVENEREFNNAIIQCGPGWYAGEYIPKVAEYRVCFVQGRVAWVAKKTPADPEAIAWNVAQGGRFDNVRWGEWPLGVVETAAEAFNVSELDFSGVDVMVGPDGTSYVLEANSAPSMTSDYRKTCITKCFDWIVNNGKEHLNQVRDRGWKGWIHPSLSGEAVV